VDGDQTERAGAAVGEPAAGAGLLGNLEVAVRVAVGGGLERLAPPGSCGRAVRL
jgi:hypothetical protein